MDESLWLRFFGQGVVGFFSVLMWATVPVAILWVIQRVAPRHEWMFRMPVTKVIASLVARRRQARREAKMLAASGLQRLDRD